MSLLSKLLMSGPADHRIRTVADVERAHARDVEIVNRTLARLALGVTEMSRILHIPAVDYSQAPDLTDKLLRDPQKRTWPTTGRPVQLRGVQNQMLAAMCDAGGGFFMARVGGGKTFAAVLAGSVLPNIGRVLIFTPASTVDNMRAEYFRLRSVFRVQPMPQVLRIHSTEELSKARSAEQGDLLDELILENGGDPARTLLVFDEAHRLKNLRSARGGRVMRTMLRFPQLRVVCMSGTMSNKSIKEAAHLAWYALREKSPYPVQWGGKDGDREGERLVDVDALAACTDVDGMPSAHDWDVVMPLLRKYYPGMSYSEIMQTPTPTRVSMTRIAFRRRLQTTPGVVLTTDSAIDGLTLHINGLALPVPPEVVAAQAQLESGEDFNGLPIPDAATAWRLRKQLAQGFYYVWEWPKSRIDGSPIVDLKWKAARSAWAKTVRNEIQKRARTGYDSEMLVYNTVKRMVMGACLTDLERMWVDYIARTAKDGLTWEEFTDPPAANGIWTALRHRLAHNEIAVTWLDWSAVEKHKKEPPTRGVWLSTFLLDHAVAWGRQQAQPPILWYEHRTVGEKLAAMGVPTYGQGSEPPRYGGLCALAIGVHSEGKNLQDRWSNQLVLCPPSSGNRWEQMLGRTYRDGQPASEVWCHVYQHDEAFNDALMSARTMAAYAEDQGNKQKLLFASYHNVELHKLHYNVVADDDDLDIVDDNT